MTSRGYFLPTTDSILILLYSVARCCIPILLTLPFRVLSLSLIVRQTVSRQICLGIKHPSVAYDHIFYCQTVAGLLMWGSLSHERTGLSFIIAAGLRQRSHSRVRVPWYSWPYFTVSDSKLSFSPPPTTSRVTVEVYDPASTRKSALPSNCLLSIVAARTTQHRKHSSSIVVQACYHAAA
jgi:hypothetical protein